MPKQHQLPRVFLELGSGWGMATAVSITPNDTLDVVLNNLLASPGSKCTVC